MCFIVSVHQFYLKPVPMNSVQTEPTLSISPCRPLHFNLGRSGNTATYCLHDLNRAPEYRTHRHNKYEGSLLPSHAIEKKGCACNVDGFTLFSFNKYFMCDIWSYFVECLFFSLSVASIDMYLAWWRWIIMDRMPDSLGVKSVGRRARAVIMPTTKQPS